MPDKGSGRLQLIVCHRVACCKDHLVLQSVRVQVHPSAQCYGFEALLAVQRVLALVGRFDFYDQAATIGATDDEIGGVAAGLALQIPVLDVEIGLAGVGQCASEIYVVDLVGRQIELVQHSEEEILLRVGVEVVRVVVEAEVVSVVTLQLLPAQQQVLFADLVSDCLLYTSPSPRD